ncbi:hypothetical protein B0H13DRAFT_2503957 [Mycena leptocephala]|nr:hypothetical protein B0H13DRAFT_2503957 [Mycena leptocephala]
MVKGAKRERKQGTRETILAPHIDGYSLALTQGWRQERKYLKEVCKEFHARVSWRILDHEEPELEKWDPAAMISTEILSEDDARQKREHIKELNGTLTPCYWPNFPDYPHHQKQDRRFSSLCASPTLKNSPRGAEGDRGEGETEAQAAKALYAASLNATPAQTPAARQRCIEQISNFIGPILQGLNIYTGLHATLIVGGPMLRWVENRHSTCLKIVFPARSPSLHTSQQRLGSHCAKYTIDGCADSDDSDSDSDLGASDSELSDSDTDVDEDERSRTRKKCKVEGLVEKENGGAAKRERGRRHRQRCRLAPPHPSPQYLQLCPPASSGGAPAEYQAKPRALTTLKVKEAVSELFHPLKEAHAPQPPRPKPKLLTVGRLRRSQRHAGAGSGGMRRCLQRRLSQAQWTWMCLFRQPRPPQRQESLLQRHRLLILPLRLSQQHSRHIQTIIAATRAHTHSEYADGVQDGVSASASTLALPPLSQAAQMAVAMAAPSASLGSSTTTSSLPPCPPDALPWFIHAHGQVTQRELGCHYHALLGAWIRVEHASRFENGPTNLSTKGRPVQVGNWGAALRGKRKCDVAVSSPVDYAVGWQHGGTHCSRVAKEGEDDKWTTEGYGGGVGNGARCTSGRQRHVEFAGGTDSDLRTWEEAVGDVTWMMEGMALYYEMFKRKFDTRCLTLLSYGRRTYFIYFAC